MFPCLLFISLFFLSCLPVQAQTKLPADSSDMIYTVVEQQPEFVGGNSELKKYIKQNLITAKEFQRICCEGKVYLRLLIDIEGAITHIEIVKGMQGICEGWNKEAIRLVQNMPTWKPAVHKGKRVRCYYVLPISIDTWRH